MEKLIELPNHKFITIHKLDTKNTIKNKIGISYNVMPNYLNSFKLPSDTKNLIRLNIKTILDSLKEYENNADKYKQEPSFKDFYNDVHSKFPNINPNEYIQIWRKYSDVFTLNGTLKQIYETNLKNDIKELEYSYPEFLVDEHVYNKSIHIEPTEEFIQKITNFDKQSKIFESIKGVDTSPFEQKKQYISIEIDNIDNYPLDYFFDCIQLNNKIPCATFGKYCKVYKTFVLNGMITQLEYTITLLYKKTYIENEPEDEEDEEDIPSTDNSMWYKSYNIITIKLINDKLVLEMDIENNANIDVIFANIKDVLKWPYDIDYNKVYTNKISGEFYIFNQNVDSVILKDIILFHPIFNTLLYSNDIIISFNLSNITKRKYKTILHYIEPETNQKFICSINTRTVNRNDILALTTTLKIGEPITVCKITKAATHDSIYKLQTIIGKLVQVYNEQVSDLTLFYSNYLKNVNNREFIISQSNLSDIAPEIFIDQYSRLCSKQKNPSIIEDTKFDDKDPSILKFPKDDDNSNVYQCKSESYPFIGLIVNQLDNKDEYQFLPCCFKKNQKDNDKSNYYKYYHNIEDVKKIETERILQTQKFANYGHFGILPEMIHKLFLIFDKKNQYYRRGMHFQDKNISNSSLLECVLDSINYNNYNKITNDNERVEFIRNERASIAERILNSGICKQECFDISLEDISNNINNTKNYLSPELYIRALEEFYNINIIVFNRDKSNPYGNFLLPRHDTTHGYIFPPFKNRSTIIVYEHTGGIWYKQKSCELVVRFNPDTSKTVSVFTQDDDVIKQLYKQWIQIYSVYETNKQVRPISPPNIQYITFQYIDIYGKTRGLYYKDTNTFILCNPIAPLNIPITEIREISNIDSFIGKHKLVRISDGVYKTADDFIFYTISDKNSKYDTVSEFLYNKRISVHLIEYALYLYSKFIHESKNNINITYKTSSFVQKFLNKYTIVKDGEDGNINYEFDFIISKNKPKLELESNELQRKLNYIIRVNLLNNRKQILNYHSQKYLNNYYNCIYDFKAFDFQEVIPTELVNKNTIISNSSKLYIYPPNSFLNHIIYIRYENVNYLGQPCQTIDEALNRLYNWDRNGLNVYDETLKLPQTLSYICIPFINKQYLNKINVNNHDKNDNFIIFVHYENVQYYISLFMI